MIAASLSRCAGLRRFLRVSISPPVLLVAVGGIPIPATVAQETIAGENPAAELQVGEKPQNLPGLHNVMRLSDRIISGSEPEPEKGLETIRGLGVKTVVSVDGGKPAVERARAHGLRYIHIPIGYDGVDEGAGGSLARLIREATGPFYIHCHHGKHRGPAAAAVAYIAEVSCEGKEALFVLERAGTSKDYPGLWRDVENYSPPERDAELPELVEVAEVDSLVAAMASVDRHFDNLKLLHDAEWRLLPDHPDLVPRQEALLVREGLHEAGRQFREDAEAQLRDWLAEAEEVSGRAEAALKIGSSTAANDSFQSLTQSCKRCHARYRN